MARERYQRQILLPQIGSTGQDRLGQARVLLVGVGALGCGVADLLVRAGVGSLTLIDRDVVDETNLHRQTLYDDHDAVNHRAKARAAAAHLRAGNATVELHDIATDVTSDNVLGLLDIYQPHILIDCTDNVPTRYLLNDVAIARDVPLVYGGCVGTEGRVMGIVPGRMPCLRCLFPTPPAPGELPTCDTAGVLNTAASIVGALQATEILRLIVEPRDSYRPAMIVLDVWTRRFKTIDVSDARRDDCPACADKKMDFLRAGTPDSVSLCGRNTVQIRLRGAASSSGAGETSFLDEIEPRLRRAFPEAQRSEYLIRCRVDEQVELSVFVDGRVLVHGMSDPGLARALVARYVG